MRHTDIERDYPCDGELIELTERCTATLTVKLCFGCGREFRLRTRFRMGDDYSSRRRDARWSGPRD